MKKTSVEIEVSGKKIILETGELAIQATASVLSRSGDTVVLATVVEGGPTDLDYFPLTVDYIERLYAGGKIKGSRWVKRDGRPSDEATLAGRIIDRSIRPLFPKSFKNQVQVIVTVMSVDGENEPDMLAVNAVSAALSISKIPWNGPIGAVRVGYLKETEEVVETLVTNPTSPQLAKSQLDIVLSQNSEKTVMIEAGASQVKEEILVEAVEKAHAETKKILAGIEELVKKVGQTKLPVPQEDSLDAAKVVFEKKYSGEVTALIKSRVDKEGGGDETADLISKVYEEMKVQSPEKEIDKKILSTALEYVMFKIIRADVVKNKKRADGRKLDEIRELKTQIAILPRTHGSALFQRGMTQALSVVTLGSPRMEQLIESAEGEEVKRFIHHYSGLPYSFGQAGRVGSPSRREIGHGALAERALKAVIPTQEDFPYTIMVVSEVLSQNGSSSMASTCGSTLALMDAGVPILKPVAGISIGMMSEEDKYELLTDIIGLEDFSGDMDFKVAGTEDGVTAIQLDVKIPGLTLEQIKSIFDKAKTARLQILKKMTDTIPGPRETLSVYAPKIETVKIPVDKIGELIGPGGKVIKNIIAQTGATVDVEDDGVVTVSAVDKIAVDKALEWVKGLVREVVIGEEFEGEVKRILPFGAFVEVLPGKEGMVHVSKMSDQFVKNPTDVVSVGQKVKVKVIEIDDQGRVNLSMLFGEKSGGSRSPQEQGESHKAPSTQSFKAVTPPPHVARQAEEQHQDNFQRAGKSSHPLAMQFRREREERERKTRPARAPYKKTHY